jgi:hypothetical protein
LFNQKKELSFESTLFVGCLIVISSIVVLSTIKIYPKEINSFLDYTLTIAYLFTGVILSLKMFNKIEKFINSHKKFKLIINSFLLILSLILALNYSKIIGFVKYFLIDLNMSFSFFLTPEYEFLFIGGFLFILIIYGLIFIGLYYFIKELFYNKFIQKNIQKLNNNLS